MITKEELQERAQLVRIHEANCTIEYPTRDEANFRIAIMKRIGLQFALKEVRAANVEGPVVNPPVRPMAGVKGKGS
jgi:hypothetical protein